jgi:hypothetical protein
VCGLRGQQPTRAQGFAETGVLTVHLSHSAIGDADSVMSERTALSLAPAHSASLYAVCQSVLDGSSCRSNVAITETPHLVFTQHHMLLYMQVAAEVLHDLEIPYTSELDSV